MVIYIQFQMLIKKIFSLNYKEISKNLTKSCLEAKNQARIPLISIIKAGKSILNFQKQQRCSFSKQKFLQQFQKLEQELQLKENEQIKSNMKKPGSRNEFLQKQQKIVKDFLQLTQESFNEHLQKQIEQKYQIDPHMLLMIISSLQDSNIIRENLLKLYPYVGILQKQQLLLLIQLIVTYKPSKIPPINSIISKNLQCIEPILLLMSQIYPKQQKIIEWLRQIPLYKGFNIYMITAGFFAIYQKMEEHVKFKNEKLLQKCIDRIIHLAIDQDEQTKISIVILALQTTQTCHFGEQLLIQIQKIDYQQVDPLKVQLLFIFLQSHISSRYKQVGRQLKTKNKYKILEESSQGQITQKIQQEYTHNSQSLSYSQISQIQKFRFLNGILKGLVLRIIDLNWKQAIKLNLLIQYWKLFQHFEDKYPWNMLRAKLITFTMQKQIVLKMTNLTTAQIIVILQVMEKLKVNKGQLLIKCLALLSQKLDSLESHQLIKLAKVGVTFVRQCEDYLISLRAQIQRRKFIFKDQQISQLNEIFKRVLVLFPRPLTK